MRKSNIMQLLEKYGKNYYNAPASKNMARTIVMHLQAKNMTRFVEMHLQVKIWQELL